MPSAGSARHAERETTRASSAKLVIERTFPAPPAKVWRLWTTNEGFAKWGTPPPLRSDGGHVDLRVGGTFSGAMRSPDGERYVAIGTYSEIVPTSRLAFTHGWEGEDPAAVTTCVVDLAPEGKGTRMRFTQTGFQSDRSRVEHEKGWSQCFDLLAGLL